MVDRTTMLESDDIVATVGDTMQMAAGHIYETGILENCAGRIETDGMSLVEWFGDNGVRYSLFSTLVSDGTYAYIADVWTLPAPPAGGGLISSNIPAKLKAAGIL
jgi:hypothetical protein